MKITRKQLRQIVKEGIFDIFTKKKETQIQGEVWLLSRNIAGPFDQHHAWIHIKDKEGNVHNLSGKSDAFSFGNLFKRLTFGRDKFVDIEQESARDLNNITPEEYNKLIKKTSWGELLPLDDWESDKWDKSDSKTRVKVLPRTGDNQAIVDAAIAGLFRAFKAYENSARVPYDPLPHLSDKPDDRNSNSFVYSLLFNATSDVDMTKRVPEKVHSLLPGWGLNIVEMQITLSEIRQLFRNLIREQTNIESLPSQGMATLRKIIKRVIKPQDAYDAIEELISLNDISRIVKMKYEQDYIIDAHSVSAYLIGHQTDFYEIIRRKIRLAHPSLRHALSEPSYSGYEAVQAWDYGELGADERHRFLQPEKERVDLIRPELLIDRKKVANQVKKVYNDKFIQDYMRRR